MKNEDWRRFRLYAITAVNNHPGKDMIAVMEQTLIGGADIVQLRNKTGSERQVLEQAIALRKLTRAYGVPLIINDYPHIALQADADGVHLGQEDMTVAEARALLGPDRIIGQSTHNLEQALAAEGAGADYIGVGPVFPTDTKPGRQAVTTSFVREAASRIAIPFVAIGGITPGNVAAVLNAGATRICSVSAIVGSDDPAAVCRAMKEKILAADRSAGPDSDGRLALKVNGKMMQSSAETIEGLVEELGQGNKRIVVELNGSIVAREAWRVTELPAEAEIELVQFVGGG